MIFKVPDIKKEFSSHFNTFLYNEIKVKHLFYEVFIYGTAYVVGGYFRDFITNRVSRDIDVIVDISPSLLFEIIQYSGIDFKINRHGGIKLKLETITMDIWCLENNWAFKNKLVKLNDEDKLNSIAKGCFYNYDALVINLNNFSYNLRYYKDFVETRQLNILQKKSVYKNLNPTTEANILRAFFLKEKFGITFSMNTYFYLLKKSAYLDDKHVKGVLSRLIKVQKKYPKYTFLSKQDLERHLLELRTSPLDSQITIDIF